jgi:hypothetical protein
MTDFTRDALDQAQQLTPFGVELGLHDGDGCELLIGKHARIACSDGCKRYTLSLDGMPGYSYPFPTLDAAVRSASTIECVFASLREGSNLSMAVPA